MSQDKIKPHSHRAGICIIIVIKYKRPELLFVTLRHRGLLTPEKTRYMK